MQQEVIVGVHKVEDVLLTLPNVAQVQQEVVVGLLSVEDEVLALPNIALVQQEVAVGHYEVPDVLLALPIIVHMVPSCLLEPNKMNFALALQSPSCQ